MELSKVIGTKLNEIQKSSDEVKLVFKDLKSNSIYIITFRGLLFETSNPDLYRRVKNVQLNSSLGFRAISQLRQLNRDPSNYRQLLIQMEGSNDDEKLELLGALRNFKVLSQLTPKKKTQTKKTPLKATTINKDKGSIVKKSTSKKVILKKAVLKKAPILK